MDKLMIFIPLFLLFVFMDWYLAKRKNKSAAFSESNTSLNFIIGSIQQIATVISFYLLLTCVNYTYQNYRIITLSNNWYSWILTYLAIDFVAYWIHRFSHRINIIWASHITHHSSNKFNLSNSFRTSPFQDLNRIPFWILLAFIGFNPQMLFTVFVVSSIIEFFTHTQNAPKLKWMEYIFVTPSLHKVHHGKNDLYIDKNYGSTFIIWDRIFGTFQEETETVEFGIKASSYQDNHAVKAITYYYKDLFKRYKAITSLKEKILIWIMPPEWEPKSIQSSQSIAAIANSNTLERNSYYLFGVISLTINILFFFLVLLFKNTMPKQYLFGYSIYYISNMLIAYKLMFLPNMRYEILLLLIKSIVAITVVLFVYVFINHQLHLIYFAVSIVCQLLIFLLYKLIK